MNNIQLPNARLDAALTYAGWGLPVLPLHYVTEAGDCSCGNNHQCNSNTASRGKHPFGRLVPAGLTNATTDPQIIQGWFRLAPCNVGIAVPAGVIVLDVDPRHNGDTSLRDLIAKHGPLPNTLVARTGGGGAHYYFRLSRDIIVRNSAGKLAPGLDIKTQGGYVVAPPSVTSAPYSWEGNHRPDYKQIASAPAWLAQMIGAHEQRKSGTNADLISTEAFSLPDTIPEGERNATLLRYAGTLRHRGVPQEIIAVSLRDANLARCAPPLEAEEVQQIASRYAAAPQRDNGWLTPEPLRGTLPPVPGFDLRLLPKVISRWIADVAERMQCPVDYLAVGGVVALGAVLGNRIAIRPKQYDNWQEVPNLWGAVVGRPGVMKTPALSEVLRPLGTLEQQAHQDHQKALQQYHADKLLHEIALSKLKESAKKQGTPIPPAAVAGPDEPAPVRHVVNDTTVEKLGEILAHNPHGVLAYRDELVGMLRSLDAEGQESKRSFFLEAWNGKNDFTFDRIGRGTVRIETLCLSVLGSMQPAVLRDYMRSAMFGGRGDDGLMQRFQLWVWPDIASQWRKVDRHPDLTAAQAAHAVFHKLANLDPKTVGATVDEDIVGNLSENVPYLRFDHAGQALFDQWWTELEQRLRAGDEHPAIESHLSKYRKLVPTLALLLHLADGGHGSITNIAVARAIGWTLYLEKHARRIYASVTAAAMGSAKALSKKIQDDALPDGFTERDVYRHCWSMLSTKEEARPALEILVDHHWLRPVEDRNGGRPMTRYYINPHLQRPAQRVSNVSVGDVHFLAE